MPRILKKYNLDIVHFPHFNVPVFWKGKFVVTIHDLILFHHPTRRASALSPLLYFIKKMAYHWAIRNAVRKSRKIIAVSEHTKKDIVEHFRIPEDKIAVTYEAVDVRQKTSQHSFSPHSQKIWYNKTVYFIRRKRLSSQESGEAGFGF